MLSCSKSRVALYVSMAENRKRAYTQLSSTPAPRKVQRREAESISAALHAKHCVYCHELLSDNLFARCAEVIKARVDGCAIIETLPASIQERVHAARWSSRCKGPPHSLDLPSREEKFNMGHSRWTIKCYRCPGGKRFWGDNRHEGDMPPDNWRCSEGDPRPSIAGDDGCAVKGHAFGVEGLRERYAQFPWDVGIHWDDGCSPTELAKALAAAGRTADDVTARTAEDICAKYFKPDDPWIECRACFALDWKHGVGMDALAAAEADLSSSWRRARAPSPPADDAEEDALADAHAIAEARLNAALADAVRRLGETLPGLAEPRAARARGLIAAMQRFRSLGTSVTKCTF